MSSCLFNFRPLKRGDDSSHLVRIFIMKKFG
jgi:hypothetical protein